MATIITFFYFSNCPDTLLETGNEHQSPAVSKSTVGLMPPFTPPPPDHCSLIITAAAVLASLTQNVTIECFRPTDIKTYCVVFLWSAVFQAKTKKTLKKAVHVVGNVTKNDFLPVIGIWVEKL